MVSCSSGYRSCPSTAPNLSSIPDTLGIFTSIFLLFFIIFRCCRVRQRACAAPAPTVIMLTIETPGMIPSTPCTGYRRRPQSGCKRSRTTAGRGETTMQERKRPRGRKHRDEAITGGGGWGVGTIEHCVCSQRAPCSPARASKRGGVDGVHERQPGKAGVRMRSSAHPVGSRSHADTPVTHGETGVGRRRPARRGWDSSSGEAIRRRKGLKWSIKPDHGVGRT